VKAKLYRHPKALFDVEESAVYIGRDSPESALRFIDAVEATLGLIADNPAIGALRMHDRKGLLGLRAFPVQDFDKHIVFYRRTERGIEVLRVLHGARDLPTIFDTAEAD